MLSPVGAEWAGCILTCKTTVDEPKVNLPLDADNLSVLTEKVLFKWLTWYRFV